MKKITALLIWIVITVFILAACSPPLASAEPTRTGILPSGTPTKTATETTIPPTPTNTPTPKKTPTAVPSPTETISLADRELLLVTRVNTVMTLGQDDQAIELCTSEIEKDPTFALAYTLRGLIYMGNQDLEAAVHDFDKAIEFGILEHPEKEIYEGLTAKAIYYLRGYTNMYLGAYKQGIEDLEMFLEISEPLEYPEWRQEAQYRLARWQLEEQAVTSGHKYDFQFYSIQAPQGQGWTIILPQPQMSSFSRLDYLDDSFGEGLYGERTSAAISTTYFLDTNMSEEKFFEYACSTMGEVQDRFNPIQVSCDWWGKDPLVCVQLMAEYEDYGSSDMPTTPPLIVSGYSVMCRHPDVSEVVVYLHYSERGPEGSLDDDIHEQAQAFFTGLTFNLPEE